MKKITRYALVAVPLVVVGIAFATRGHWTWLLEDGSAQTVGAVAPALEDLDGDTDRLYRIRSDDRSSVTYSVEEVLAGTERTAEGTTTAVAGDIAVNTEDPSASRIGTIVVNIEQFRSDSALRDKRIRTDFLNSTDFPMAEFEATSIEGIPEDLDGGATAELTIEGDLTVAETTAPATFTGTATLDDDTLTADLTTTVLMSDYEVGPISVAGLVKTGDEVDLTFHLVADRTDIGTPAPDGRMLIVDAPTFAEGDFADTIQPIVEARCASCHVDDGAGAHTIELATAGDVAEIADEIKLVTAGSIGTPLRAIEPATTREPCGCVASHVYVKPSDTASARFCRPRVGSYCCSSTRRI